MAYLVLLPQSQPIDVKTRPVEWIENIGTWGILAFLVFSFIYERRNWHGPQS